MFDIILRYLYGFAKIHLRGIHINRFVNLCKARDIKLWDLEQKEDEIFFFTASKDIARLEEPARKTESDVEILRVYGIREFIRKNKKRIPFVAGFILFAVLIYIQSLFIWEISVSGESDYTSDEILQHINEYYVQTGTPKSKVDCAELEKNLRKDFEDIAWISCALTGTKLSVEITETLNVCTDTSMKGPCNIVASKNCTIAEIVTASGTPVVKSGDDVKKGDVLISGAVYLYDDNNEVMDTNYVSAEGEVYGICVYHYDESIPRTNYVKEYTGNEKKYYSFGLLKYDFTPYVPKCPYDTFDRLSDDKRLHIGKNLYLPFEIKKTTVKEYTLMMKKLSEKDATDKMQEKLNHYIGNLQEKGVQIVRKNVIITNERGEASAEGDISIRLPVAVPRYIDVNNTSGSEEVEPD